MAVETKQEGTEIEEYQIFLTEVWDRQEKHRFKKRLGVVQVRQTSAGSKEQESRAV